MKTLYFLAAAAAIVPGGAIAAPADLPFQIRPLMDTKNIPPAAALTGSAHHPEGLSAIARSLFVPPILSKYMRPRSVSLPARSAGLHSNSFKPKDTELIDSIDARLNQKTASPPGSKAMHGALCGTVCHISYQGCLKDQTSMNVRGFLAESWCQKELWGKDTWCSSGCPHLEGLEKRDGPNSLVGCLQTLGHCLRDRATADYADEHSLKTRCQADLLSQFPQCQSLSYVGNMKL